MATAHHQEGNTFLAEILANQGLVLAEGDENVKAKAHAVLARILFDQGRLEEAESQLRVATVGLLVNGDVAEAIEEIANLGLCLVKMGKVDEGLKFLTDAATRAGEQRRPRLRVAILLMQGKGLYSAGRKNDATGPLLSALRISRDHTFGTKASAAPTTSGASPRSERPGRMRSNTLSSGGRGLRARRLGRDR